MARELDRAGARKLCRPGEPPVRPDIPWEATFSHNWESGVQAKEGLPASRRQRQLRSEPGPWG